MREKRRDNILKEKKSEITEPLPNKVLLRISDVAQYFDVTERTVRLWIEHRHLEIETTPGGQLRVTKESVDRCRFRRENGN